MTRYPIEMQNNWWVIWSLPIENTINGEARAQGLETFPTYDDAWLVIHERNKKLRVERGMPPLPPIMAKIKGQWRQIT